MFRKLFGVFVALACMVSGPAQALVIDFEGLAVTDAVQHAHGMSYTEKGFNFTSSSRLHNFATWGTLSANFFGSTALWNGDGTGVNGITTLTKVGGGAFDLLSIDLAELLLVDPSGGAASVNFTATFSGGGTASQSFTLDDVRATNDINSFQTLNFSGFNDIVSVSWLQVTPFHQFDNVTIRSAAIAVAEPSTLALFAAALAGLAFFGWRSGRLAPRRSA